MRHGWIKAACGTPEIRVADCVYNAEQAVRMMRGAAGKGAHLLAMPELGLTGYTCGDLFLQNTLLDGAVEALRHIARANEGLGMIAIAGLPLAVGGSLYNCAAVIYEGQVIGVIPKSHLPNYGEFYEQRHFAPSEGTIPLADYCDGDDLFAPGCLFGTDQVFVCKGMPEFAFSVEICEDLWAPLPPSVRHALAGAMILVNLSASDETIGKAQYRRELVCSQSARLLCGYLYANAGEGESTGDMVFAGHDLIAENGAILTEKKPFEDGMAITEIDVARLAGERRRMTTFNACGYRESHAWVVFRMPLTKTTLTRSVARSPFVPDNTRDLASRCEEVLAIQATGLKKRIEHTACRTAVVGISGGLDSCLALLVTARAMDLLKRPHTDVLAVTMPCFGTTARTKNNAMAICQALGVTFRTVDITASVRQHFADIGHRESLFDVTYENSQARERMQVLMDIANQTGGIVVGTGDLSELALGWATYNGDHMSMYGVNASVPKTLVRHLVRYAADSAPDEMLRRTLLDVLDTPVSPELLPPEDGDIAQKTEELVGPYDLHDFFLYYLIRCGFAPTKIFYLAEHAFRDVYNRKEILKWLKLFCGRFFSQQFKRSCMPEGPKVGSVSLSPRGDWRMPSDACAALWLEELDRLASNERQE